MNVGMTQLKIAKSHRCFGGEMRFYTHESKETSTLMRFGIYLPPNALAGAKCPVVYFLSGLTCTDENFSVKSGFQKYASELGLVVVAPDTSPRGAAVEGEDASWDFGSGAGFYVDAVEPKWAKNYRMYSYCSAELPTLIRENFPVISDRQSIMGHSMGGHGALVIGLKNQNTFRSISAFSPICAPSHCPWGEKAFSGYLGRDRTLWAQYDAVELIKARKNSIPILIDQGSSDEFLTVQLKPQLFLDACKQVDLPVELNIRDGYDHSYFFISTFIGDNLKFNWKYLNV